jgi:hypothetical protein
MKAIITLTFFAEVSEDHKEVYEAATEVFYDLQTGREQLADAVAEVSPHILSIHPVDYTCTSVLGCWYPVEWKDYLLRERQVLSRPRKKPANQSAQAGPGLLRAAKSEDAEIVQARQKPGKRRLVEPSGQ